MSEEISAQLPDPVLNDAKPNEVTELKSETQFTEKSEGQLAKPFQNNAVSSAVTKRRRSARVRRNLFMCSPSQLFLSIYGNVAYDNCTHEEILKNNQRHYKASLEVEGKTFIGIGSSKSKAKEIAVQRSLKPKLATWLAPALSNRDKPTEPPRTEEDDRPWPVIVAYAVTQLYRSITSADDAVEEREASTSPTTTKRKITESQACLVAGKKRKRLLSPEDSTEQDVTDKNVARYNTKQMNSNNAALFRNLIYSKGFVEPVTDQQPNYGLKFEESYNYNDGDYESDAYDYNRYDYPAYGHYGYGGDTYTFTDMDGRSSLNNGATSRTTPNPLRADLQDIEAVPSAVNKPAKKIPQDAATRNPLSVVNELMPGTQFDISQENINEVFHASEVFHARTVVYGVEYSGRGTSKKQAKAAAAVVILRSVFGIESSFEAQT